MNRIRRIAATAVVTALLGFMGAGVSASPAAAGCTGYACQGFDPIAQACSATSTVTTSDSLVVLQNRKSQGCVAKWARAELTNLGYNNGDKFVVWIQTTDGTGDIMCYPGGPSNMGYQSEPCSTNLLHAQGFWYTDMVEGSQFTHALVNIYDTHGTWIETLQADQ